MTTLTHAHGADYTRRLIARSQAIDDIVEVLWPNRDPGCEWDVETIERVADVLDSYGLRPDSPDFDPTDEMCRDCGFAHRDPDQCVPHCDHCGRAQDETPAEPWNGETGCHRSCEAAMR